MGKLSLKADEPQVGYMKRWKRRDNIITKLPSLKELEILRQDKRVQVNTRVTEYFKSILFHKSGLANKQHTHQSTSAVQGNIYFHYS